MLILASAKTGPFRAEFLHRKLPFTFVSSLFTFFYTIFFFSETSSIVVLFVDFQSVRDSFTA